MRFRNFTESILGSKVKIKILMYMLSEGVPTSEREISRILNISHMAVNKAMGTFRELNLVSQLRIGNVNSWKFNKESYAYEAIAINNLKWMAAHTPFEDFKEEFGKEFSTSHLTRAVIFGSIAEGMEEPDSDIDLLIITNNSENKARIEKKIGDFVETCMKRYGNVLSPHIITEKETNKTENVKILKGAEKGIQVI